MTPVTAFDPPVAALRRAVATALAEDMLPLGDLTASLVEPDAHGTAGLVSRQPGVVAGTACVTETYRQLAAGVSVEVHLPDGEPVIAGERIATVQGPWRAILSGERTALNFLCHLSGVATLTRRYVEAVQAVNPRCRIWDTRKTTPGLRALEKPAVRAAGALNHRGNLSEGILVKDNHLGSLSITKAVAAALASWPGRMVEVECDRYEQVLEAVEAGATLVMCDNMTPDEVRRCAAYVHAHPRGQLGAVLVEASGGITLENVAEYARADPDVISVGALTHSAPILDIGLDLSGQ